MYAANNLKKTFALLLIIVVNIEIQTVDAACEGTVTFYWKESLAEKQSNKRNWGKLEEQIIGSKSKLELFIDTENTYAYTVNGDCCWELYSEKFYKGDTQILSPKLTSGFAGIKGFPKYKAKSLKKMEC